jgi:hypothetical protein
MSEVATSPGPAVFQLRVVLAGINPLIWRRLLVPADTTNRRAAHHPADRLRVVR